MEFDKTRVYTAVNAEDLPIGSKCIFADTMEELEDAVNDTQSAYVSKLQRIAGKERVFRFVCENHSEHNLVYLVESPKQAKKQKELKYKPFSNMENLKKVAVECKRFIKAKQGTQEDIIIGISFDNRVIIKKRYGLECLTIVQLFERYTFDDGSPCGELVEVSMKVN